MKQRPASPQSTSTKPPPIQKPALTPTGPPTLRKRDSKSKDLCPVPAVSPQTSESSKSKDKDGGLFQDRTLQPTSKHNSWNDISILCPFSVFINSHLLKNVNSLNCFESAARFYTARVNICQGRLLFWKPGRPLWWCVKRCCHFQTDKWTSKRSMKS